MDLWKIIGTTVTLGLADPTIFSPSIHVPFCKHPAQKFFEGRYRRTSRFGRITKNLQNCFSYPCLLTNTMVKLNLKFKYVDAWNKMLEGKYEMNTGLPLGEGSYFRVCERGSSVYSIDLGFVRSRSGRLRWCSLHTPHPLCFLRWREVGEALAGVFLVSVFSPP
jgi:hypothetical protein